MTRKKHSRTVMVRVTGLTKAILIISREDEKMSINFNKDGRGQNHDPLLRQKR
jgi:hypothetical protein